MDRWATNFLVPVYKEKRKKQNHVLNLTMDITLEDVDFENNESVIPDSCIEFTKHIIKINSFEKGQLSVNESTIKEYWK